MATSAEIRQQLVAAMSDWFPSSLGLSFILEGSSTLEANPAVLCLRWIASPACSKLGYPGDQLSQLNRVPRANRQRNRASTTGGGRPLSGEPCCRLLAESRARTANRGRRREDGHRVSTPQA